MLVGFTYRNVRRKKDNIAARDAGNLLLEFLWLNPLIYYSLIRNLKDAFYLLLIPALGMFLAWVLENEGDSLVRLRRLLFVAVSLGLSYVLYNIRPWAFFSSLLAVGLFVRSRVRRPSFAIILLMFVVIGFLRTAFIARAIAVWFPVILANFRRIGLLTSLAGALKFVVGPGPVRSILGSRYFLFYTDIGNLAAFIGSIMWWVFLAGSIYFIMKNIREFGKTNLVEKYFLYTTIVYIAIYAVTYGGSAELRLRGVMYVIGGFSIVNVFYDNRYRLDKEIGILSGIILVFVGGIVFGV